MLSQNNKGTLFKCFFACLCLSVGSITTVTAKPAEIYKKLKAEADAIPLEGAVAATSEIALRLKKKLKGELSSTDATLIANHYYSKYDLYRFSPKKAGEYKFVVKALAEGHVWGANVFKPLIYLQDENKQNLPRPKITYSDKRRTFSLGIHLNASWVMELRDNELVYIILAADNSRPGSAALTDVVPNAKLSPLGDYQIYVRKP